MDDALQHDGRRRGGSRFAAAWAIVVVLTAWAAFRLWVPHVGHPAGGSEVGGPTFAPASFMAMVEGTASKPFVARALVPTQVKFWSRLLLPEVTEGLAAALRHVGFADFLYAAPYVDPAAQAVWYLACLVSLGLYAEGLRRLLETIFSGSRALLATAAVVSTLAWSQMTAYHAYMYDPMTPTFVVWMLYAAVTRRWLWYGVLLAVATVHKETTVAVPLAVGYLQWARGAKPRTLWPWLLAQPLAIVAARVALSKALFPDHLGGFVDFHLLDHNVQLSGLMHLRKLVIAALLLPVALHRWSAKPPAARATLMVGVPLLLMAVFFGFIDEIRQYTEALPGFTVMVLGTLALSTNGRWIAFRPDSRDEDPPRPDRWEKEAAAVALLGALGPLAVLHLTPLTYWRVTKTIAAAQLNRAPAVGTAWNDVRSVQLQAGEILEETLTPPHDAHAIEVTLDCNDRYVVSVRGARETRRLLIGPDMEHCPGLVLVRKELTPPVEAASAVTVTPLCGDGLYTVGHLIAWGAP